MIELLVVVIVNLKDWPASLVLDSNGEGCNGIVSVVVVFKAVISFVRQSTVSYQKRNLI